MSGDPVLLLAAVVFAAFALFTTILILFLRSLADTFAPVINYCASRPAEQGPIIAYWYNPNSPVVASFFGQLTDGELRPGDIVPGQEGKDWGVIRGPVIEHEHATADVVNCCVSDERAS